ncbi:ComF family protein [Desulfuribacillus alkaliarsenatis]|uniref:Phosphoribosyltransferase domain-containing protein n=1 Tax=Desulfuribacillus alkaliarsenatis TaxID=766136 RepID=A0A1E5G3P2_9FIRM|nr:ComF family protein [Desulfuribacillus alkaliarsenatis]OEF97702.1 hypothetical protein BHF68_13975 [Desulfuribacillus alkaliarsenatis]
MSIKTELTSWLQALGDLVYPKPPVCTLCNKSIYQAYFLEYSVENSANPKTQDDANARTEDNASARAYSHRRHQRLTSKEKRYLGKTRIELADHLCSLCYQGLKLITAPFCHKCGRTMTNIKLDGRSKGTDDPQVCQDCIQPSVQHRAFKYARAAAEYNDAIQELIHQYKYRGQRNLVEPLQIIMCNVFELHFKKQPFRIETLIPVPLHENRLAERGFNQALQISKHISNKHKIPIADILERTEYTEKQSKKSKVERTASLEHAFKVKNHNSAEQRHAGMVKAKSVLLIDDIYTTGTTVDACAGVLKEAGAKEVYVLTLAR